MQIAGLDEAQAGIKIAMWNINNLKYADDTTLMAESEEKLKRILMKEESEKAGLKLSIKKWRSWHQAMETVTDFIFLASKITAEGNCSHEIKRCLLLGRRTMTKLDCILKSRNITLPTKVRLVKAMFFPVVIVWMWELDYKESWAPKNWCFWTAVLEKALEISLEILRFDWRSNQSF